MSVSMLDSKLIKHVLCLSLKVTCGGGDGGVWFVGVLGCWGDGVVGGTYKQTSKLQHSRRTAAGTEGATSKQPNKRRRMCVRPSFGIAGSSGYGTVRPCMFSSWRHYPGLGGGFETSVPSMHLLSVIAVSTFLSRALRIAYLDIVNIIYACLFIPIYIYICINLFI